MNRLLLCLLFLLSGAGFLAHAQVMKEDTTTNEPFFAAKKFDSKFYVGFEMVPTQILKTKGAMNLGFSLNWVVNHKFVASAKYHVLTTPVNVQSRVAPDRPTDTFNLQHHYAGLGFSYILFANKKFSFQPELSAGWGMLRYRRNEVNYTSHFGMIIPAVYGVYNATKNFRLGVGLNYRIAAGSKLVSSADMSGVGGVVFLRVGTF
ncbi:MAG TPA: hypothetical protein VK174_09790 [Chitinophagales bacterium]|nr:hypothetical protein [Chitinophagales bacterium]